MNHEDLSNINACSLTMPSVPQALGELIVSLVPEEPDAIVIDRLSGTVIVYPRGTTSREDVAHSLSITSLLSNYEVHMLAGDDNELVDLLNSEPTEDHLALFIHPGTAGKFECPTSLKLVETKVLNPEFAILCCKRASTQSTYKLRGATLKTPVSPTA
jgi:hypothetical protein